MLSSSCSYKESNSQLFIHETAAGWTANTKLCADKFLVQVAGMNILRDKRLRLFFHNTSSISQLLTKHFSGIKASIKSRLLIGDGAFSEVME